MCFCKIVYPIVFAAHAFMQVNHCTGKVQSSQLVAVDEGTHYTILVYYDSFCEQVHYSY